MQPDQLVVDADRRAAGRQAEHAVASFGRALADQIRDLPGDGLVGLRRMRKHADRNALALGRGSDIFCTDEPVVCRSVADMDSIRVLIESA